MSDNYTIDDFVYDVKRANTPLVHKGQIVAVAHYSKKLHKIYVVIMKGSEKINIQCITVATFKHLESDNMPNIETYAITDALRKEG